LVPLYSTPKKGYPLSKDTEIWKDGRDGAPKMGTVPNLQHLIQERDHVILTYCTICSMFLYTVLVGWCKLMYVGPWRRRVPLVVEILWLEEVAWG
jgi:hypothetical protein